MTNQEKYAQVFMDSLTVDRNELVELKYMAVENLDSVGHMNLIAALEEAFDIMMDTDDILDFDSYEKGMKILREKYALEF